MERLTMPPSKLTLETHWQEYCAKMKFPAELQTPARRIFYAGAVAAVRTVLMTGGLDIERLMAELREYVTTEEGADAS